MARDLERIVFAAGEPIFYEDEEGSVAYIVERGCIEIWRSIAGVRIVLGMVVDNGVFGEMALIDRTTRAASATALEETTCVVIPKSVLDQVMADADAIVQKLVHVLITNVRSATDRLVSTITENGHV